MEIFCEMFREGQDKQRAKRLIRKLSTCSDLANATTHERLIHLNFMWLIVVLVVLPVNG